MSRYIDAESLKRRMDETLGDPETGDMGKLLNIIIAGCIDDTPTADVVSREVFEQVKWERDTAIQQLEELGYGLGERREDE